MPVDDDVYGMVAQERDPNLLEQARTQYPYLKDKEIDYMFTPTPGDTRKLEFYGPEETQRPEQLPAGRVGVQVFDPSVRPIDILGDYVSHYGVQQDPRLAGYYQQFGQSLDPELMRGRYDFYRQQLGEQRPYEQWYEMSGLPEMFRGYTFNQFGEGAERLYTPEQLNILNQVRQYLGITK